MLQLDRFVDFLRFPQAVYTVLIILQSKYNNKMLKEFLKNAIQGCPALLNLLFFIKISI